MIKEKQFKNKEVRMAQAIFLQTFKLGRSSTRKQISQPDGDAQTNKMLLEVLADYSRSGWKIKAEATPFDWQLKKGRSTRYLEVAFVYDS